MSQSTVVNLIGLSAMFTGHNKLSLDTQYKLYQFHDRIRQVLNKSDVIGMFVDEAVRMYMEIGWSTVEVIEDGIPPELLAWGEEGKKDPTRMRLWVKNDKVVRAIAG